MKKLVIIIPARRGSKRLKNKNELILGSKKLIEHTILFAKKLVKNDCIILSTDSNKIKNIGKKLGILAPWIRPRYLSKDKIKSEKVVLHSVNWYEKKISKIKAILLLQPTTPFRNLNFFQKAIKTFFKDTRKNLVSVNLIKNKKKIKKEIIFKNKVLKSINKKKYMINGSLYLINLNQFKRTKKFVNTSSVGIPINGEKYQIDIDYLSDFKKAKKYEEKNTI